MSRNDVDADEIAKMFQDRYGLLLAVARRYAPAPDLVYDIVQQAFVSFMKYAMKTPLDPERDITPFLHEITKNLAIKHWKEQAYRRTEIIQAVGERLAEREFINLEYAEEHENTLKRLGNCMEKLQPQSRDLLEQYYFNDDSINDISSRTNRSSGAIRKALCVIRFKLRECIERLGKTE